MAGKLCGVGGGQAWLFLCQIPMPTKGSWVEETVPKCLLDKGRMA